MDSKQNAVLFFDIFQELCRLNGEKVTNVTKELDLSPSTVANWKISNNIRQSTVERIEKHFNLDNGVISDLLMGLEAPYSAKYYQDNWRIILRSMFPNAKPLPGVDDLAVLSQSDLNSLKEYIQTIRENLIRIESLVYGDNKKDRH